MNEALDAYPPDDPQDGAARPVAATTDPLAHGGQGMSAAAIRKLALEPGPTRDRLYAKHPVTKNKMRIATPPVKAVYEQIVSAIVHRDPGNVFVGEWRVGKTFATEMIVEQLANTFPQLPTALTVARGSKTPSRGGFATMLLSDLKHAGASSGRVSERELRLVKAMVTMAKRADSDSLLLFIDEGQCWGEDEFGYLRDLANLLHKQDVALITIIFASENIEAVRTALLANGRKDLIWRFLLTIKPFAGICSVEDLTKVFADMDDPMKHSFPRGSGIALSEFFAPAAFRSGWRLAQQAQPAWDAFASVAADNQKTVSSLGMTWVVQAVQHVLFSAAATPEALLTDSEALWEGGVARTAYADTFLEA